MDLNYSSLCDHSNLERVDDNFVNCMDCGESFVSQKLVKNNKRSHDFIRENEDLVEYLDRDSDDRRHRPRSPFFDPGSPSNRPPSNRPPSNRPPSHRPDRPHWPDRPDHPDRPDRPDRPHWPDRPGSPHRPPHRPPHTYPHRPSHGHGQGPFRPPYIPPRGPALVDYYVDGRGVDFIVVDHRVVNPRSNRRVYINGKRYWMNEREIADLLARMRAIRISRQQTPRRLRID